MKKAQKTEAPVEKVTEIPAACPQCKSTKRTKKQHVVSRQISGVLPTGQEYTHVKNYRADCRSCGQRLSYNSYVYDPEWKQQAAG